jgi:osmotically inducible protein OsmC
LITKIDLTCQASVPGISAQDFAATAENAKQNCPVSRALAGGPQITLSAELLSE